MHYTVTVGYESEQLDREGNPRLTKSNIIVQAESNAEANITASKFLAGDIRSSQIIDVKKLKIDCIIDDKNTPEYFKTK
jgi:hypothetical protein